MKRIKIIGLVFCLIVITVCLSEKSNVHAEDYGQGSLNINGNDEYVIMDKDDFENLEDYYEYLEKHPEMNISSEEQIEANANYNITVLATPKYKIIDNSADAWTTAFQKTFKLGNDIYMLQRSGSDMRLTRCVLSGDNAYAVDHMLLNGFGHSQTLDFIDYDGLGRPRFIIASKANTDNSYRWSLWVGRLTYSPGTICFSDIPCLSNIQYANISNSSYGTLKRVDAALTPDKSKLIIWSKNVSDTVQYSVYNMSQITSIFNTLESSTVKNIGCDTTTVSSALIGSNQQTSSNAFLPNNSFQGLDFKDNNIMIIDGGKNNEVPKVGYISGYVLSSGVYNLSWLFNATLTDAANALVLNGNAEIESPQVIGDTLYCSIYFKLKTVNNGKYSIYTIPISSFYVPMLDQEEEVDE